MDLIHTKLLLIEYATVNCNDVNRLKLIAIREIRDALFKIDLMAETVPLESVNKLCNLLKSLKGIELSTEEIKVVNELVKK